MLNPHSRAPLAALDVVQPGLGGEFVAHVGTTMALAAAMPQDWFPKTGAPIAAVSRRPLVLTDHNFSLSKIARWSAGQEWILPPTNDPRQPPSSWPPSSVSAPLLSRRWPDGSTRSCSSCTHAVVMSKVLAPRCDYCVR